MGKEKIDGRQPKELFESKLTSRSESKSEDTQSDKTYDSIENPSWHNSVLSYHHPITRVASPNSPVTSAAPINDGMSETKNRGQPMYADYRDLKKVKATSYHL
ncbi:unnamed protein product [Lymnaea stagnalis]|uniref:Uncharacterized protein n=1 Tax=Lymnaea stagnalis TaxID=6523 RepID=A0AAV2HPP3_LYMST